MTTVVPKEMFLVLRALRETRNAVGEISRLFSALKHAMQMIGKNSERWQSNLDKALQISVDQKASHDRLHREFQLALNSPDLETLIEARDAYLRLHNLEMQRRKQRMLP